MNASSLIVTSRFQSQEVIDFTSAQPLAITISDHIKALDVASPIYSSSLFTLSLLIRSSPDSHQIGVQITYADPATTPAVLMTDFTAKNPHGAHIFSFDAQYFTWAERVKLVNLDAALRGPMGYRCAEGLVFTGKLRLDEVRSCRGKGDVGSGRKALREVVEGYGQYLFASRRSDFEIRVVSESGAVLDRIPAHSFILVCQFKYFDKLLDSQMSESRSKDLEIAAFDPTTLRAMLTFAYTGTLGPYLPQSPRAAVTILNAADYFGSDALAGLIEDAIVSNGWVDRDNVVEIMEVCVEKRGDLKRLRRECGDCLVGCLGDEKVVGELGERKMGLYMEVIREGLGKVYISNGSNILKGSKHTACGVPAALVGLLVDHVQKRTDRNFLRNGGVLMEHAVPISADDGFVLHDDQPGEHRNRMKPM
ncbi:hypothetical protein BJ742DRAFT_851670 [Cladochytrium replicatum]|nr:hypothetical protein BJ742DRAFT_851670 [Cladochytrium replicatum]